MNTSERTRARETALRLASYFDRHGAQVWARKGAERAREWLRLVEEERPDASDVRRLLSTLEEGSADGGSAWDEMLITARRWVRECASA